MGNSWLTGLWFNEQMDKFGEGVVPREQSPTLVQDRDVDTLAVSADQQVKLVILYAELI